MIKRLVISLTAVATLALAGCGTSNSSTTESAVTAESTATPSGSTGSTGTTQTTVAGAAAAVPVTIQGYSFSPAALTVKVGTTVTWTNKDSVTHTVTSGASRTSDGKFDKSLSPGDTFSFTFDTAGTYAYYCRPHTNMVASVIVQ